MEFLTFGKVEMCLCNPAGEGHWQLALFILNLIHTWRPLSSLDPLALMVPGNMLEFAVCGHPTSLYYLILTIVHFAIGLNRREVLTVWHVVALQTFSLL